MADERLGEAQRRPRDEWPAAGRQLRALLDQTGFNKQGSIARALKWPAPKLTKTLNGGRIPTFGDLRDLAELLAERLDHPPSYEELLALWAVQPPESEQAGQAPPPGARRMRRRRWLLLGGAVIAVIAVVAAVLWTGSGTDPVLGGATEPCIFAAGARDAGSQETLAAYSAPFEAVYEAAGGADEVGCPSGPMRRWQQLVVQELVFPDRPGGTIVAADPQSAIHMGWTAWTGYKQIGGKSGDNAQSLAGLPVALRSEGLAQIVELDTGGLLVGERPDAPFFWVHQAAVAVWEEDGGMDGPLGLPAAYPQPRGSTFAQDFAGGSIVLTADAEVVPEIVDDAERLLAELGDIEGTILRHSDATTWYVQDGSRLWIKDGGIWECLGGWDNLSHNDVPGYVIFALPYGGWAEC